MKVLLAEDNEDIRYYLTALLERWHYEVIAASDGQQAWDILQRQEDMNLVVSDWMMPNMDGLQLCQTIRSVSLSRYIYIILLTAKEEENALVEGMRAGADDFLFKPVNVEELRVRLTAGQRILNLEQSLAERNQALTVSNQKLQQAYGQISQDLQSAAKMQKDLLPKPRTLGGIDFEWLFYPSHYVAGDIFNFFELNEDFLGFYQLDVSGHGVRSALLSFTLYHRIANEPHQSGLLMRKSGSCLQPRPPDQVLYELNNRFQSSVYSKLYFTIVYGHIHKNSGKLQLAQAGHPHPIYLARSDQPAKKCGNGGFPVGMLPNMHYETLTLWLKPGERLFIYSDGITECANSENAFFSEERLLELLGETRYLSLKEVLQEVGTTLRTWRGSETFDDDTTLLAIERI